ncbi:MAG TPA: hypothetical protein VFA09_00640 [Ktedonobacteraceae bacterium]|nr:hypothetical protein [Ktedonobacteraceae bacterium]
MNACEGDDFARAVAIWSLSEAQKNASTEIGDEVLEAIERASTVQKSPLFKAPANHPQLATIIREETTPYEVRKTSMSTYPTPHLDKLRATLTNDKLPSGDKPQVEKAIEDYEQWVANMEITMEADPPAHERLKSMVDLLNEYRKRMDIDLIFDSQNDWLHGRKDKLS